MQNKCKKYALYANKWAQCARNMKEKSKNGQPQNRQNIIQKFQHNMQNQAKQNMQISNQLIFGRKIKFFLYSERAFETRLRVFEAHSFEAHSWA